jgi:iron(II)-dependent oxidoreductase
MVVSNRERWAQRADVDGAIDEATREVRRRFAVVPEGFTTLPLSVREIPGAPEIDLEVQPYRLAIHPVTNADYQYFVDAGGYGELELWPRDLWPQLPGFVDLSGRQAPRRWREGRHDRRLANHPVVGVCYYEAAAYARWAGYRLPTEAEWQMAASWRLRSLAHLPRRFPWGDALDTRRCNVWATGLGATAPVDAYPDGAAPNGVQQLIGNVWEWTSSDYDVTDDYGSPVVGDMPMKSVRGGAFDTYFPAQAASTFRTGLAALARANNAGFRCAIDSDFVAEAAFSEDLREPV